MKKAVTSKVEVSRVIWSNIRKAQYLNGLSDEQLAGALEVTTRTLNNYDNAPCTMTLERLDIFLNNMGMSIEQLIII